MRKRIFSKFMAMTLACCMIFQANVFASDPDVIVEDAPEVQFDTQEPSGDEMAEEIVGKEEEFWGEEDLIDNVPAKEDADVSNNENGDSVIVEAADEVEVDNVVEGAEIIKNAVSISDGSKVPVPVQFGVVLSQIEEELVGAFPKVNLDTTYSFSCPKGSSGPDFQIYTFTPSTTAVYRVDVTGTKGKTDSGFLYEGTDDYYDAKAHGAYVKNDLKYTVQLQKGTTYYFYVGPNSNRAESGKFKIRQVKKAIETADIQYYTNKTFTVGPKGAGNWAVKKDGSKDFNVWLFNIEEMKSLIISIKLKFKDGTSITWKPSGGFEVGSTGLLVIPEQVTNGWKLDQKAYMKVYCGNMETTTKIQIPYKDPLFKDVRDQSNPYYKAIYWAAGKGITKGYKDGTFGINKSCNRGEAVMFLWRMAGKPAPKAASKSPFKDVPTSHTFYKAILWASQKGVTTGYKDKTFRPKGTCTRGQIMTFIWRYKGKPAPKTVTKSPFKDVPKSHTYYKAILWGSQKGVTKGFSDGTFGINKNCSRGQIVTFLYRIR